MGKEKSGVPVNKPSFDSEKGKIWFPAGNIAATTFNAHTASSNVHGAGTVASIAAATALITTHAGSTDAHIGGAGTVASIAAATALITTHAALTAGVHGLPLNLPIIVAVTAQFNKTADTALANVLSIALAASSTYGLEAYLFVDADAVGGHKYALDGAVTANSIKYQVNSISNASNLNVINTRLTALAGTTGQAGATGVWTEIIGVIASSAAGSINVQFAQQVASGTSSILTQSSFKAVKI